MDCLSSLARPLEFGAFVKSSVLGFNIGNDTHVLLQI
jgi:hypothetical protein